MKFIEQLAARTRTQRGALERARLELALLTQPARAAAEYYQQLSDAPRNPSIISVELDDARIACGDLGDRLRRKQYEVSELANEVRMLEGKLAAPEALRQARDALTAARAATGAAVAMLDSANTKSERLEAQLQAEQAGARTASEWARETLLAKLEGRESRAGTRPPHSPSEHDQTIVLLAELMQTQAEAKAQAGRDIAELRATERDAEQAVLQAAAAVAELQYSEALATFGPQWARFRAAHVAAFDYPPAAPDLEELGRIGEAEAMDEARAVLAVEQPGLIRKLGRKLGEVLA